jgi:hypothetical protein
MICHCRRDATAATFHGRASPIKEREPKAGQSAELNIGV